MRPIAIPFIALFSLGACDGRKPTTEPPPIAASTSGDWSCATASEPLVRYATPGGQLEYCQEGRWAQLPGGIAEMPLPEPAVAGELPQETVSGDTAEAAGLEEPPATDRPQGTSESFYCTRKGNSYLCQRH